MTTLPPSKIAEIEKEAEEWADATFCRMDEVIFPWMDKKRDIVIKKIIS